MAEESSEYFIGLERAALDRWGKGDPGGFLDLYGQDISYFDPLTAQRLDGWRVMADYYGPYTGKIFVPRYEMLNPRVVIEGSLAVLSYQLVNYARDPDGRESVGSRWNSTVVFQRQGGAWKSIHVHWSFTNHPAFQNLDVETSERAG